MSDGFSLGKNDMVNTTLPGKTCPIISKHAHKTSIVHAPLKHTSVITNKEEKIVLVLVLTTSAFVIMVRFSIMRGARRGDRIEVTSERGMSGVTPYSALSL